MEFSSGEETDPWLPGAGGLQWLRPTFSANLLRTWPSRPRLRTLPTLRAVSASLRSRWRRGASSSSDGHFPVLSAPVCHGSSWSASVPGKL